MRFGSVCSGIEAASVIEKTCAKCGITYPLDGFHRQPSGPQGRHSYCKSCANAVQKASRKKNGRPAMKRKWQLSSRYGLTEADVSRMDERQSNLCGICATTLVKPHIDHDHQTGKVRGLLCHACNIALGHVERIGFLASALAYLKKHEDESCAS